MRVLLVGDTHRVRFAVENAFDLATKIQCDKIFQLGDFGFYPKDPKGSEFLKDVAYLVEQTSIPFYFLGGNHEDWAELDKVHAVAPVDEDGFHIYANHIRVAPRAHVWTWDGMNFISLSGAYSIDRDYRIKDYDWFERELPDQDDLEQLRYKIRQAGDSFHADVMLAHDAPVNLYQHKGEFHRVIRNPDAEQSQQIHSEAIEEFAPHLYIHGHWHMYYNYFYDTTQCIALNQTSTYQNLINVMVIDTDTRILEYPAFAARVVFELPDES